MSLDVSRIGENLYANLASRSVSTSRAAAIAIGEKDSPTWDDYFSLLNRFHKASYIFSNDNALCEATTWAIARVIEKLPPLEKEKFYGWIPTRAPQPFESILEHNMYHHTIATKENIATIVRLFFERNKYETGDLSYVTNRRTFDYSGYLFIRSLINSKFEGVRRQGALAIYNTQKYDWIRTYEPPATTAKWLIENLLKQSDEFTKRYLGLTAVALDPSHFFLRDSNGNFVIFKDKDTEIEKVLLECAKEGDSQVRAKAFAAIGTYLEKYRMDDSTLLDEVLMKGIVDGVDDSIYAIYFRLKQGKIRDGRLIDLLIKNEDNPNDQIRCQALGAIGEYLNQENKNSIPPRYESHDAKISRLAEFLGRSLGVIAGGPFENQSVENPQIKSLARRHFNDEHKDARDYAIEIFGIILANESKLRIENSDINMLLDIGQNDQNEKVRASATFALSVIAVRNLNRLTISQEALVQALCTRFEGYEGASEPEREMISEALTILEKKADRRKAKVVRSIRDPKIAKEAGDLFELDKTIISELKQKVQGFREELTEAKEEIQRLRKKNTILKMSLSEKRTLVKKVITKLRDANSQIEKLKSRNAKKQAARLILTCAGLAVPHFHLLGLSADLITVAESASKYVEVATIPKALKDLIHQN